MREEPGNETLVWYSEQCMCTVHVFYNVIYPSVFLSSGWVVPLYLPHLCAEFVTASAGSKVLAKLSELRGLFDRVCLIIEDDPVREGRRKTTYVSPDSSWSIHTCIHSHTWTYTHSPHTCLHRAQPGQYLECALARLIASRVTVLFSHSQGSYPHMIGLRWCV